ncbi:hypothetical protein ElyMa_001991800 [Elysia marginata]|uniref:Uncharacterized protein n=1 Tax=Elysia marginata TaxID=1093978 RepID=A0AAV4F1V6_9GAST|nr:hypothetical protein ElyMa_001991800 [Elysia marginata]
MSDLEAILQKLDVIQESVSSLTSRVSSIEVETRSRSQQGDTEHVHHDVSAGASPDNHHNDQTHPTPSPYDTTVGASGCRVIQREFDNVRDSLIRVPLPKHYKVNDSAKGISKDCKSTLSVISKCARYAETGLKAIASLQPNQEDEHSMTLEKEEIQKLFTVFSAQINFLQAEFANQVVKSTFDEETSRIFRSFENNTGAFSGSALQNIRLAAELASHRPV